MISEATPFAPHKWRTKVPKNTPERDLKHRRQETINKVRTEIAVMQDRIIDWRSQIIDIGKSIEDFTAENDALRLDISTRTKAHEPQYRVQYEQKNLAKLKQEYEQDKLIHFDYLIAIAEDEPIAERLNEDKDSSPKNGQGQRTKWKQKGAGRT